MQGFLQFDEIGIALSLKGQFPAILQSGLYLQGLLQVDLHSLGGFQYTVVDDVAAGNALTYGVHIYLEIIKNKVPPGPFWGDASSQGILPRKGLAGNRWYRCCQKEETEKIFHELRCCALQIDPLTR
jgi:hypothetical protein